MGNEKAETVKSMSKLFVFLSVMGILTTAPPLGRLYIIGFLFIVVYFFIKIRDNRQLWSTALFGYTFLLTYYEMFINRASGKIVVLLVLILWLVSIIYFATLKVDPVENVTMTTILFISFVLAHETWIIGYNVSALVYITFAIGLAWVAASLVKDFGTTKAFAVTASIIIFLAPVAPSAVAMEKVFVPKGSYYLYVPVGVHGINLTGNKSDAYLFAYDGDDLVESAKVTVLELLNNVYVYESNKLPNHLFVVIPSNQNEQRALNAKVFIHELYFLFDGE